MTKNTLIPLLLSCLVLSGCSTSENVQKEFDYSDFENLKISWNLTFFAAKSQYFLYIYSLECLHCNNIKNEVLSFANDDVFPIYFCEWNSDIPAGDDAQKTIGSTSIDEVFILGVPTLLQIDNGVLTSNCAGTNSVLALLYSKKK